MTEAVPDLSLFRASLARATETPDFFALFYDRFMKASPEIAEIFHNKDMERLKGKLKMTLEMLCENAQGQPGLTMYLDMLGSTHARLDIRPVHFALWREALLATVAECDPELDSETRRAWETVIDDLIAKLGADPERSAEDPAKGD